MHKIADCVPFGNRNGGTDLSATLFTYNPDGKLIKQTDPEGKEVRYGYDLDGRLKKTIDGNGNETSLEYESGSGSSCSTCSGAAKEQPSKIVYPTFTKEFRYDARGRKSAELDILSATETYTTGFAYDAVGMNFRDVGSYGALFLKWEILTEGSLGFFP